LRQQAGAQPLRYSLTFRFHGITANKAIPFAHFQFNSIFIIVDTDLVRQIIAMFVQPNIQFMANVRQNSAFRPDVVVDGNG
jgi:hypothetical protein